MTFYIAPETAKDQKSSFRFQKESIPSLVKKKQADGYQIKIARDKQFTRKAKTVNIKKTQK